MTIIYANYVDDVHMRITSDNEGTLYEIREKFTFLVPNHKFMPLVQEGLWDGKIRLFNIVDKKMYVGLLQQLVNWCSVNNVQLQIDPQISPKDESFDKEEFVEFIKSINIRDADNKAISPYVHQWVSTVEILQNKRRTIISPTASGKSLIAYMLIRWLQFKGFDKKILIVVPTQALVEQMYADFDDYAQEQNWKSADNINRIYDYKGMKKTADKPVYVSTWQSIHRMGKGYFQQFGFILIDEAHTVKATSLTGILEKTTDCEYKAGMTGTLDDAEANEWVIEGLLGARKVVATTEDLIERGIISNVEIKILQIQHNNKDGKWVRKWCKKYPDEVNYIEEHEKRNNFICNLANAQEENTLILFTKLKHGDAMKKIFDEKFPDKKVYLVTGKTDIKVREEVRRITEKDKGIIILATYGVFSTGINIKNLHNIIFASSTKSKIRVLQSIGRALRLHIEKVHATVFDIVDDFSTKSQQNHVLRHFIKRFRYYTNEHFNYKIHRIKF